MAQQTINVGTAPNDGTGTPLRTAFQYTNSNFSELYTALGGGSGLPGATTQVIFNDGGTNLAGDAGLVYNKTTDALTIGGNVQAASATITGDLTVDTNVLKVDTTNNVVGIGTSTPNSFSFNGPAELVVANNAASGDYCTLTVASGSTGRGYLAFANGSSGTNRYNGSILYDHTSNYMAFQTTAGAEQMRLNSTGLGVGTSPVSKLTISDAAAYPIRVVATAGTTAGIEFQDPTTGATRPNIASRGAALTIETGGSERFRIDSSGNVGIGVAPSAWNSSYRALQIGATGALWQSASGFTFLSDNAFVNSGASNTYITTAAASFYRQNAGVHTWWNAPSGTAGTAITFTQAMTLDASGNLLVRCTTAGAEQLGVQVIGYTNGNYVRINHNSSAASGDSYLNFLYNATQIGSITQNGTTGVLYNTTSDYRLKESVQPLVGGLARVNALKPSIYKWKSDGSSGEGFLAHELAEVVPFAVTGEKDAVNEDGSVKAQGVDMSRVVPVLVAAIQELTARVQTLETR